MEIKAILQKPYTEVQRMNFVVNYNHNQGYEIKETEDELQALGYTEDEIAQQEKERISKLSNLCPHFHLSLQSGCTETLARMRRRYTADEYRVAVELLRSKIPDVSITTDVIVGFPGETDEEFDKSFEFCKSIGFMQMHIFKYSVRKGTAAADFDNQIPEPVKEERSQRMIALGDRMKAEFYNSYLGREIEVLAEQKTRDGRYHATAANYMEFLIESNENVTGKLVKYLIT